MDVSGRGGFAGTIKGKLNVILEKVSGGTRLWCGGEARLDVGLMPIEMPLLNDLAEPVIDHCLKKFTARMAARTTANRTTANHEITLRFSGHGTASNGV
jgi:carbon monoxide dehydrogenase subunit G